MSATPNRRARVLGTALAAVALLVPALAATTSAAGGGAVVVTGVQRAYGTCTDAVYGDGYEMTGDLTGCWWITDFQSATAPDKHNFHATGTEHFRGCLYETTCGEFDTTYTFSAKTDGAWAEGAAEIHGRCHHPIDGDSGTEGFAGITGELSFHDVLSGPDSPNYPYWGPLRLQLATGKASTTSAKLAASSGSATASTC